MPCIRFVATAAVFACIAPMAEAQDRPIRQTAPVAINVIEGPDLVVTKIQFYDTSLNANMPGVRQGADQTVQTDFLTARVWLTNQGNARWSSSGTVECSFALGDIYGPSTRARAGRPPGGVSVVPRSSSGGGTRTAASSGTFRMTTSKIFGSVGPGEGQEMESHVLTRSGQKTVSLEFGKSFTITAKIIAAGEPNNANNTSTRVGRVERTRTGYEVIWEPLTIRTGATVMVNAPR